LNKLLDALEFEWNGMELGDKINAAFFRSIKIVRGKHTIETSLTRTSSEISINDRSNNNVIAMKVGYVAVDVPGSYRHYYESKCDHTPVN
jgi:viroplasmin and RNaseH domain-containing protein